MKLDIINNPSTSEVQKQLRNGSKRQHTLARGARQFVVQLALETMLRSEVYLSSLTPTTNIGASLLGAEIITFLAPPYIIQKQNAHF
jgi:hypothetical protein